jgi:hypothetical protein
VPGGTANWTFTDVTGNYNDDSGSVSIVINKVNASIDVTAYNVTFDSNAHTATGTATGVKAEDLSSLLNLTGTTHTAVGDYPSDSWSFAGNTNYNSDSGTVHDVIAPAAKVITSIAVTPTAPSIALGQKQQFTAIATYSDNSTGNISGTATWNSSNLTVATINSSGLATSVAVGTTNITATQDSVTSNTAVLTVTPTTGPTITVIRPDGGERWSIGTMRIIRWTSTGIDRHTRVRIELSRDGGSHWTTIFKSTPNDGSALWVVTGPSTTQALIRITTISTPAYSDTSDAVFTIERGWFPWWWWWWWER